MQRPVSRLYLRTAMYIGGALAGFVLVGAAIFALIAAWELQDYIETRDSSLGQQAAAILKEGGEAELISWMQTEAPIPPDRLFSVWSVEKNVSPPRFPVPFGSSLSRKLKSIP